MAEKIKPHQHIIDIPTKVFNRLGIEPNTEPIRGGTDGSQLSFMGLPTPNIFTGCGNFHGPLSMPQSMLWKKPYKLWWVSLKKLQNQINNISTPLSV